MLSTVIWGLLAVGMSFGHSDGIFFRSDAISKAHLVRQQGEYTILDDDGEPIELISYQDDGGVIYWYRRLKTAVCQTGECKMVDVGIYWDCAGDFFGLDVYGEHLTKTDHSVFRTEDYDKLISILSDDWSLLREYEFSDLTVEAQDSTVDATSGATRTEIASEAVKDAVYTTYTLWHLIHKGEKEQITRLTTARLDDSLIESLIGSGNVKHKYFLLDVIAAGGITVRKPLQQLLLDGIRASDDPYLQDLAFKGLAAANIREVGFHRGLAAIYEASSASLKLRIVTALKDLTEVHAALAETLSNDLTADSPWLAARILPLLSFGPPPDEQLIEKVRLLSQNTNMHLRNAAEKFLQKFKQKE